VLTSIVGVEPTVIEGQRERRLEAARNFPAAKLVTCLADVEDSLDAVVIATPPSSHAALGLQAIEAGLHVLIEKPMATSIADATALIRAAHGGGLTLMVGHTFEYNNAVRKLKKVIASGELGRILYIDTARLSLGKYQSDCNVIWDLAPHDISIVSYLLDEFPHTVSVWAHRNLRDVQADVGYLRMDFRRAGIPAFTHVSWLSPRKVRRVTVVGERKMAVYNDLSDNERIRIYDMGVDPARVDREAAHSMPVTYRTGDILSPDVQFVEPLLVQDEHFIDCIRTGRKPATTGESGRGVVEVLAATDTAITSGAPAVIHPLVEGDATTAKEVAS
jgi:predicted dehydrogenase